MGTISIPNDYFKNLIASGLNQEMQQWITLFDDVDDDGFDGELGEDDEELPMVFTKLTMQLPKEEEKPQDKSVERPQPVSAPTPEQEPQQTSQPEMPNY